MEEANRKKAIEAIVNYITDVSFKPLLESNLMIADMYDAGEISHKDFYGVLEDIKKDTLKKQKL